MKKKEIEPTNDNQSAPLLRFSKAVKIGENPTELDYMNVPIASFGAAMLHKMGWMEGLGMGRDGTKGLVKPIEFIPRHHRLGLGGAPIATMKIKGGAQDVNSSREKSTLQSYNHKYLDEEIKTKDKPGTIVLIKKGKYEGMYGRVLGVDDSSEAILNIELIANDKKIKAPKEDVIIDSNAKTESKPKEKHRYSKKQLRWVLPGIFVRIISKNYLGGKYYMKKLRVDDVPDTKHFTLVTDKGNVIDDLNEEDIETVMPHEMEDVMILTGNNRGEQGKLIMRNKKKNQVKVQLYDKPETVLGLTQDDCSALYNK